MVTVNAEQRARILRFASHIVADPADPVAACQAALPLLDWAEQAEDRPDLRARIEAMAREYHNTQLRPPCGDPSAFLGASKVFYDFITSGPDGAKTEADYFGEEFTLDDATREKLRKIDRRLHGES